MDNKKLIIILSAIFLAGLGNNVYAANHAPTITNLSSTNGPYCTGIPGIGIANFSWTYNDQDCDKEKQFKFQVATDASFDVSSLVINYTSNNNLNWGLCSGGKVIVSNSQTPLFGLVSSTSVPLKYNITYHWRVRVYDSKGLDSGWSSQKEFKMIGHPAPNPDYSFYPIAVNPNEMVVFQDGSLCYTNSSYYLCKNGGSEVTYSWNFGDGSPYDTTKGNTSHIYSMAKLYSSRLRVCDDGGCCYSYIHAVPVGKQPSASLPSWREVSPF